MEKNKFHRVVILDFLLIVVFFPLLIICIFLTAQEAIIWIKGKRIEAKVTSIDKIENDRYLLHYVIIDSNGQNKFSKDINLKTFNHLKDRDKLNLIYLAGEPYRSISLDLDDRNDIIKLGLAIVVLAFLSFAGFKSMWGRPR
jgi:hypothetical protein